MPEVALPPAGSSASKAVSRGLKLAATAIVFASVLLMPSQSGLTPEGQRVLAIVAAAVVLWATEAVPVAVASFLVVVLLMVMGVVKDSSAALVGFSSSVLYFLLGSLVMGAAVMQSGLAERLAVQLVNRSRGSSRRMIAQLMLGMPLMAFIIPSAVNRNAMLIPAYEHAFRSLSVGKRHPLAKVVMLSLGMLNPFASSAFMTGGVTPMTLSTLIGGFTWFRWFVLMAIPYYFLMALGGLLLYLLFRPPDLLFQGTGNGRQGTNGHGEMSGLQDSGLSSQDTAIETSGQSSASSRGPLSRDEKVTLAVISVASVLWLTDFLHHWNAAVPALIAAVVLMTPGVGILSWSQFEKSVGWSIFFVLGASLSLTQALVSTGAASWFAQGLMALLANSSPAPVMVAIVVILVTAVVHLGIPNMAGCIALLIPVVTAFAEQTGINPVAAGLIVGIAVDTVVFFPVQTATNLLAYETGNFELTDVFKYGLGMLVITFPAVLLMAIPWWNLMGVPFTR